MPHSLQITAVELTLLILAGVIITSSLIHLFTHSPIWTWRATPQGLMIAHKGAILTIPPEDIERIHYYIASAQSTEPNIPRSVVGAAAL